MEFRDVVVRIDDARSNFDSLCWRSNRKQNTGVVDAGEDCSWCL